jgi:hypothetical protein
MITFKHNSIELRQNDNLKALMIDDVNSLNEKKFKILEKFLNEIEQNKHNPVYDIDYEYNEKIKPQILSFGGKISGKVRKYKSNLVMYILECLINENKNFFEDFASLNYIIFSKMYFDTAPTKKTILKLLDKNVGWQDRNFNNKNYRNKEKFETFMMNFINENEDDSFKCFFEVSYRDFQKEIFKISQISKEKLNEVKLLIKDSIDEKA